MSSYITMKVALHIIYSLGTPVSYTNKADRYDVTEILLKVALNTINHEYHIICMQNIYDNQFHCNIIFLIKIFLENLFNFTFQRSTSLFHIIYVLLLWIKIIKLVCPHLVDIQIRQPIKQCGTSSKPPGKQSLSG
jgi:hypothetical protein